MKGTLWLEMRASLTLCLGLVIIAGLVAVAPQAAAAPSTGAAVGGVINGIFYSYYQVSGCDLTGTPLTVTLLRDGIQLLRLSYVCIGSFFGYVFWNPLSLGRWTLQLSSGVITFFVQDWLLPTVELTASAAPGQPNTGDSVWIGATLRLKAGGLDFYDLTARSTIEFNGAKESPTEVAISSGAFDAFFGTTTRHTWLGGRSMSFGTAGSKTVTVIYGDGLETLSTVATLTVVSPTDAALATTNQRVTSLEANITAAQRAISDLQGRLDAQKVRADRAESNLAVARSDLSTAQLVSYVAVALGIVGIIAGFALRRRSQPAPPPPGQQ